MRSLVILVLLLAVSGCARRDTAFKYEHVYAMYAITGGVVSDDSYHREYIVNDTMVSCVRKYANGSVSFAKSATISVNESKRMGENIVDAGVYGMLDRYTPSNAAAGSERAEAVLFVSIDGRNKTVTMKPFVEDYMSGNLQKAVIEVKMLTQAVQA